MPIRLPHDQPDNLEWLPGSTRYPMNDAGELAARLGSIVTYDRRGEVLFLDDMRFGIAGWRPSSLPVGASVKVGADVNSTYGYKMILTSGADAGFGMYVTHTYGVPALSQYGAEFGFAIKDPLLFFSFGIVSDQPTTQYNYEISFNLFTKKLEYRNTGGTYTPFANIGTIPDLRLIQHVFKMVADVESGEYMRVLFDNQQYDLSGIAAQQVASSGDGLLQFSINLYTYNNAYPQVHVNYFILTGNEP
jgi:hypothetical protein